MKKVKFMMLFSILITVSSIINAQNISVVTIQPMQIVYVTDTALKAESISQKMGIGYGKLFALIGQQQLKSGKVMAIYYNINPPWLFDIAVEVDKAPAQLTEGVQFKIIEGGEAIVLNYKGAYEQMDKAYLQIDEWLKKNNKQKARPPIEVYLNDPAMVVDKNELLTDIYQFIK